ncbi:MAG: hypothetical protein GEU95_24515 [Rhizobiales bacterium]|nr:hypothetical protein [Hyphomicrobiales bacterium]
MIDATVNDAAARPAEQDPIFAAIEQHRLLDAIHAAAYERDDDSEDRYAAILSRDPHAEGNGHTSGRLFRMRLAARIEARAGVLNGTGNRLS